MSRARTAYLVAQRKEAHPELFCPADRCLWRTETGDYCPRHRPAAPRDPNNPFITATDPELLDRQRQDAITWAEKGFARGIYDTCQRCGRRYGVKNPSCPNQRGHGSA